MGIAIREAGATAEWDMLAGASHSM